VAITARSGLRPVKELRDLRRGTKLTLREKLPKLYSQDLLSNLFRHPYTRIEFVEKDLGVSRITAARYLEQLTAAGLGDKRKIGKTNFYINRPLFALLSGVSLNP